MKERDFSIFATVAGKRNAYKKYTDDQRKRKQTFTNTVIVLITLFSLLLINFLVLKQRI